MSESAFIEIEWRGAPLRIEHQWVGDADSPQPVVVFLHEGLGSLALWKEFPHAFCTRHRLRGMVFSRYGYGQSTPRPPHERWQPDFMHRQAREVLPALFEALGIVRPWLFGHSDGASIALLYAAGHGASGVIAMAPHIFVEDLSVSSIEAARNAYATTGLRERLSRYHADVDSAFLGWNDAWLNPAFRSWNIEAEIARIACPLLAVQGEDDEYGTLQQIRGIACRVPQAQLLVLAHCGHSPQSDQPERLSEAAGAFIVEHTPVAPGRSR